MACVVVSLASVRCGRKAWVLTARGPLCEVGFDGWRSWLAVVDSG
jgi:hypothetical protein